MNSFNSFLGHGSVISVLYNQSRGKKSKSMSGTKNQKDHAPGKSRGPKRTDGEFVYRGQTLLRQYGLTIYPGENVSIGRAFSRSFGKKAKLYIFHPLNTTIGENCG